MRWLICWPIRAEDEKWKPSWVDCLQNRHQQIQKLPNVQSFLSLIFLILTWITYAIAQNLILTVVPFFGNFFQAVMLCSGPKADRKWIGSGSEVDRNRIESRLKVDQKSTKSGSEVDRNWTENFENFRIRPTVRWTQFQIIAQSFWSADERKRSELEWFKISICSRCSRIWTVLESFWSSKPHQQVSKLQTSVRLNDRDQSTIKDYCWAFVTVVHSDKSYKIKFVSFLVPKQVIYQLIWL